jgi:hypothetical protein
MGLATGEDIEQAGIAGLTAAGTTGVMSNLGDYASDPDLIGNLGQESVDEALITPMADSINIPAAESLDSAIQDEFASNLMDSAASDTNAFMMAKPLTMAKPPSSTPPTVMGGGMGSRYGPIQVRGAPGTQSGPDVPTVTPDLLQPAGPDAWVAGRESVRANTAPYDEAMGQLSGPPDMYGNPIQAVEANKLTGEGFFGRAGDRLAEGASNLQSNLGTGDNLYAAAKHNAPELLATGAGMTLQGGYDDRMAADADKIDYEAAKERKRQTYWDTVNAINASYGRVGRTPPTSPGGGNWASGPGYAQGGVAGRYIQGRGTGESDSIPAVVDGREPARISTGEFVVPAKTVQAAGGPNSFASVLDRITRARGMKDRQKV